MKKKKILVLLGHSDWDTVSGYFATRYEEGAREAGHEVERVNVGDLQFDPILHKGYKVIQELEPDLVKLQEKIKWADHMVVFYPNWWCTMPAILKGLFDRMFLPGFAFRMTKDPQKTFLDKCVSIFGVIPWKKLLTGRSARVVVTMDSHPLIIRFGIGDYTNEIRNAILKFTGFSPVKVTTIGPIQKMGPERRSQWGDTIARLGKKGK